MQTLWDMNAKAVSAKLLPLLESCTDTATFLEGVQLAIEQLYADSEDGYPAGFAALDAAVEAFRQAEER